MKKPQPITDLTVAAASAQTGIGLHDIQEGMRLWPTRRPHLAAYYMLAKSHAIVVKGDRDKRNREWAWHMAGPGRG